MFMGLNPYSNGMKIEQALTATVTPDSMSLNPYSNGMKIEHIVKDSISTSNFAS